MPGGPPAFSGSLRALPAPLPPPECPRAPAPAAWGFLSLPLLSARGELGGLGAARAGPGSQVLASGKEASSSAHVCATRPGAL